MFQHYGLPLQGFVGNSGKKKGDVVKVYYTVIVYILGTVCYNKLDGGFMSLREDAAYFAKDLKLENNYTYDDLTGLSGLSRKQVSAILNGYSGVSFTKIEEFFGLCFGVVLSLGIGQILSDSE